MDEEVPLSHTRTCLCCFYDFWWLLSSSHPAMESMDCKTEATSLQLF